MHTYMQTSSCAHYAQALYVLVAAGTTVFSYFWDVERDWELGYFSAPKGKKKPSATRCVCVSLFFVLLPIQQCLYCVTSVGGGPPDTTAQSTHSQQYREQPTQSTTHNACNGNTLFTGKRPPFPLGAPTLPRELLYTPDFYYYLMFSNLVLRFMWLTRLVPSWAASCVVCCMVSSLEVCRYGHAMVGFVLVGQFV